MMLFGAPFDLTGPTLGVAPLAYAAGFAMGINPCCFALSAAAAATCCAQGARLRRPLPHAVAFALGTVLATTALGLVAATAGRAVLGAASWLAYVVALVPVFLGMHLLGWITLLPAPSAAAPEAAPRANTSSNISSSFVGGLVLSVVLGPCGTPALAAILAFAAVQKHLAVAGFLLFSYGLGIATPMFVVSVGLGGLSRLLARSGAWSRRFERGVGFGMLAMATFLIVAR